MKRLVALGSALLAAGCATATRAPLCHARTGLHADAQVAPREWFSLLLHGYSPERNEVPRPPLACEGSPIVLPSAEDACGEQLPGGEPLPAGPLTEQDVVTAPAGENLKLVWVVTRRFFNGEAVGPVALVEASEKGLSVRALGTLRSLSTKAQLRLEHLAGVTVLVAEGESCGGVGVPLCRKVARLMPLRNDRFIAEPLSNDDGSCAGPASVYLLREKSLPLAGGGLRRSELSGVLTFRKEDLLIEEHVAVRDFAPQQPASAATVHHNADGQRVIRVHSGSLVVDRPSLWVRVVEGKEP